MNRRTKAVWRRRLDAGLTALMVAVTGLALWALGRQPSTDPPEDALPTGPILVEGLLQKGREDSKAAVILFSDFQCPYCATFAAVEMQTLLRDVADSGLALVQFANFPLETIHPLANASAQALECARHEQFGWEIHDRLFELSASKRLRTRDDVDLAIASALTDTSRLRVKECVGAGGEASRVAAQTKLGWTFGVSSTPTFVIGQRKGSAFFPQKRIRGGTNAAVIAKEIVHIVGRR